MRITTDHSLQPGRLAALLAIALLAALVAIGYRAQPAHAAACTYTLGTGTVSLSVNEGAAAQIPVTRSGDCASEMVSLLPSSPGGLGFATVTGPDSDIDFSNTNASFTGTETSSFALIPTRQDIAIEGSETFTLTLQDPTGPSTIGGTISATVTILDDDGPPHFSFSSSAYNVTEGTGSVQITVNRSGASGVAVSVQYSTIAGTAGAGDFTAIAPTTLNFAASDTSKTFNVSITNDLLQESTESFSVHLSGASNSGTVGPDSTVNILDNDGIGTVQFKQLNYNGVEGTTASFAVSRTGGSTGSINATCATTQNGTATAGVDYTTVPVDASLFWADGDTSDQMCQVAILADADLGNGETFGLTLTSANLGSPSSATVTIIDSSGTGTLQFSQATYSGAENGGAITVTVTRTGGSSGIVTVDIATSSIGSTATANVDYVADATTLVFNDGDTSESWTVSPIDDLLVEGAEHFHVVLSNPTGGAVLGAQSSAQVTINDNESPLPQISSIAPSSGSILGGTAVTITGLNFTGATSVTFDGLPCTSVVVLLSTSITCVTPAHTSGVAQVIVTTPAGSSSTTGTANDFTYTGGPTITLLDPATGPSTGNTIVTVTGTNFTPSGMVVRFDGVVAVHSYISSTSLVAVSPAHAAATVSVTVTTPGGTSPDTAADDFVYTGSGAPVVSSLSPVSGPIGTTVVVTGSGFTGASLVTFGGVAATFSVNSSTQITTSVPAGTPIGTVDVRVTNAIGTSANTAADNFANTSTSSTVTFTLYFRFTLIVWTGPNNISALAALIGLESPDNPATNNVSSLVGAIWRFDPTTQSYKGYFPGTDNIPGANDFTTLTTGAAYFIALLNPGTVTWTTLGSN